MLKLLIRVIDPVGSSRAYLTPILLPPIPDLLKLIAMPLVLSSLITGVASLSDLKKLSRIGGKTIVIYIGTTAIAVTIGLLAVNLMKPGDNVPIEMKEKLQHVLFHKLPFLTDLLRQVSHFR